MSWLNRFLSKSSMVGSAIAQFGANQAQFTPRRYDSFAKEGYLKNVIAFRCVSLIAESAASVPWRVYNGDRLVESGHPLNKLAAAPNPRDDLSAIVEAFVSYYMIAGNAYVERTTDARGNPLELFTLRPDRMKVALNGQGAVAFYEHEANGMTHRFDVDPITGKSNIYHMRHFHPLNDVYGMAAMEAAAYSVDQHNFAGEHNAALLQNSATPASILVFKEKIETAMLDRAEKKLAEKYSGASNSGKTIVLGGDMDFKTVGMSNSELGFNESKLALAREICAAFGVPHELVVSGESTYNNKAEARLFLWEEKVIPLVSRLQSGLMTWLAAEYPGYAIRYDLDDISALAPKRESRKRGIVDLYTSGLLRRNEARVELGFDEIPEGDRFVDDAAQAKTAPRISTKQATEQLLQTVSDEIDQPQIAAKVSDLVKATFDALLAEYGTEIVGEIGLRSSFNITDEVLRFSERATADMIQNVNRTTKRLIRNEIEEAFFARESVEQIRDRIVSVLDGDVSTVRAKRIAETEVTKLTGFAGQEAIGQAGLEQKEWLSTLDRATRDTHAGLNGDRVPVGSKFRASDGDEAEHPGGFRSAGNNINCRCAVVAVFPMKSLSPDEKKALWDKREKQRQPLDKSFMETSRKMFTMQLDAILTRFDVLAGL